MSRILIITPDIHGPIKNGGIGTAFSNLAIFLVQKGNSISIAYTLGTHSEDGSINNWVNHYEKLGVEFIPLIEKDIIDNSLILDAPYQRRTAWITHQWLSKNAHRWDIVIFPEWGGFGFYALTAKKQGLAYSNLRIVINTHSPEAWAMEGNRWLPSQLDDLDRDFMERESVRLADAVVSPSCYMLDWMRSHQWKISENLSRVIPNLMTSEDAQEGFSIEQGALKRTVFFGRLEMRKGLKLFCDAIDRLSEESRKGLGELVFLGKAIYREGFDSNAYIQQRSQAWGVPEKIISNLNRDQALELLRQPGTLAVMPSLVENSPYTVLECLRDGVVFLATKVGGIPEMIAIKDHDRHLFAPNPKALADRLTQVIQEGVQPAQSAWTEAEARDQWLGFLSELGESIKNASPASEPNIRPLVSICLVHYNRPHLLTQALNSLRQQAYPNIEVVLVDDGSPSVDAQAYLDGLSVEFEKRDWQIIRQKNCYLGTARNNAAEHARGEYLLFMDDDNVALPEMVATFVHAALNSGADILTAVMMPFSSSAPPKQPERLWIALGGALGPGLYRNAFGDANALWRKSAFEQLGGYTTDYGVGHEDWELFADAVLSGLRMMLIPKPLYWYRVNPAGMLRAGDSQSDHARSVRPFLRHDQNGLGMALAYALHLQRAREISSETKEIILVGGGRRLLSLQNIMKALYLARNPSLRAQFIGSWRSQGIRIALKRALMKASR